LYFTKDSLVQSLIHQIKYKHAQKLAFYMGEMLGRAIWRQERFHGLDLILPLPLTPARQKQRGYNQSALLAEGISAVTKIPVDLTSLRRSVTLGTQTHKSREERWQQMQAQFSCPDPVKIVGRSVLLVDDVITTGATLDACSTILNGISGVRTSIAALAIALK
jgi:ComF family protein